MAQTTFGDEPIELVEVSENERIYSQRVYKYFFGIIKSIHKTILNEKLLKKELKIYLKETELDGYSKITIFDSKEKEIEIPLNE